MRSSVLLSVSLVFLLSAVALALEVPISVEEPVGAARTDEVVSGGIPLPKGAHKDPEAFSLFESDKEVPVQVSPITKFPDGSMNWALVSFPVTTEGNKKLSYVLKDKKGSAKPKNPVVIKESGDTVEVSNGIVSFTIDKGNFNGFESVTYKGKEVFKAAKAALTANGKGGPCTLTHFEYRYKGPVRTTIYMKGTYGDQKTPTWAMAITLNAGESTIHLDHNLRNGGKGVKNIKVGAPKLHLGVAGTLDAGGKGEAPKKRAKDAAAWGWVSFTGAADVLVFIRHGGPGTPTHKAAAEEGELVVQMGMGDSGEVGLPEGAHKTTEIDLVFSKAQTPEALREPLHALAACSHIARYDSFGVGWGFGSLEDETQAYKNYKLGGATGNPKKMPNEKPYPELYKGWLDTHATSEADQMRGLTVRYVQTGQRGFLDRAAAWSRFYRSRYYWRTDDYIKGKEGGRNIGKWVGGRWCGCHAYSGVFNYGLLTGNIDALEAGFEGAETANADYGSYSKTKPGAMFSWWGSRSFAREYVIVARAYEIARTKEWQDALIHCVNVATKTVPYVCRDPRGFTNHVIMSTKTKDKLKEYKKAKGGSPDAIALLEKEGTEIVDGTKAGNGMCRHPKYGDWHPRCVGTWPEAMEARGNYMAAVLLSKVDDPAAQLAAEDAKDYAIAEAQFGLNWAYDKHLKQMYYYFYVDFPIPGYVPIWKGGKWAEPREKVAMNGWYTRWWPDAIAYTYVLGGGKQFRDMAMEVLVQGRNRDYWTLPKAPDNEVQGYASIEWNTKGDWVSPCALTSGVCANPRKDEQGPTPVADLAAKALGEGKVELSWTAPADEGGGKVALYQVKYADRTIKDYPFTGEDWRNDWRNVTYWNMATNVLGEPKPGKAGAKEKMTLEGLPAGKKLSFAMRSEDDAPNRSPMSNVVEVEVK